MRTPSRFPCTRLQSWSQLPVVNGVGEAATEDRADWPRYVRITDIKNARELRADTFKSLAPDVAQQATLAPGDLVLAAVGASYGKSLLYLADTPACYAGYLVRVRPHNAADARFLSFWTESRHFWDQVEAQVVQATIQNFSAGRYRKLYVPTPSASERAAIADFLDRKTAAIDALIEKKERLLALLAEKRAALIHRAVTKGLDPTVPMKDSGIPWIGEIPAHWTVGRLKDRYHFVTSGPRGWGQFYSESGELFLRITNVDRGAIDLLLAPDKLQFVEPPHGAEGVRTRAKPGDLLVTITADIGSIGVVPDGLEGAYVSQHIALCRSRDPRLSRFFGYCALSAWGGAHFRMVMDGGTKLGLALDDVRTMPVPLLPVGEASELARTLESQLGAIAAVEESSFRLVERLREYRQALITAAVTGQLAIDEVAA